MNLHANAPFNIFHKRSNKYHYYVLPWQSVKVYRQMPKAIFLVSSIRLTRPDMWCNFLVRYMYEIDSIHSMLLIYNLNPLQGTSHLRSVCISLHVVHGCGQCAWSHKPKANHWKTCISSLHVGAGKNCFKWNAARKSTLKWNFCLLMTLLPLCFSDQMLLVFKRLLPLGSCSGF